MTNDTLREFSRVTHQMSKYSTDVNVLTGNDGPHRFAKRLVRRELMRRVIGPALNNLFRRL